MNLDQAQITQLKELALRLIDQRTARVLIPPLENKPGFWFGGGNIIQEKMVELLFVVGTEMRVIPLPE